MHNDLVTFWDTHARALPWFKTWNNVLDWQMPFAQWFVGGEINASYACLDVHMQSAKKDHVALYWTNEQGDERKFTYRELFELCNSMAASFHKLGVKKGDVVVLYMPMVPEAIAAMLAVARLGAIHSVVFSGFSAQALADRINDSQATCVITADIALRRGKQIHLKEIVDHALMHTQSVKKVVVVKRTEQNISMQQDRDVFLHDLLEQSPKSIDAVSVSSNHPLFMLYTSGTTGKPKGIVHNTGGYLTYVYWTMKWVFDPSPKDIYWCTADVGWVTGHSYIVYAPLMHGLSLVVYEGALDYPSIDIWWKTIEKYDVSIFYTSPTALRMFMKYGDEHLEKYPMKSLKKLGSVGEPINPEVWHWYHKNVGKGNCPIVDTWWQTETGGCLISAGLGTGSYAQKAGSATKPMPGIEAVVLDEFGKEVSTGTKGYLAIKNPWPGLTAGIYNDSKRYQEVYWSKFPNMYYPGDYAIKDTDGDFWLLGRADEVLNIAGHRIGTAELESAAVTHNAVAEAAAIGVSDDIKGESAVVFAILKRDCEYYDDLKSEVIDCIRNEVGSFAVPRDILFVPKLPKTRSGKIMRRIMKAVLEGKSVGDIATLEDEASVDDIKDVVAGWKSVISV